MEIEKLINLDRDELLLLLVPEEEKIAYSKEGMIARGIEIFNNLLEEYKGDICKEYCKKKLEYQTLADATNIIMAILLAQDSLAAGLIAPFAVLMSKYGLDKICKC